MRISAPRIAVPAPRGASALALCACVLAGLALSFVPAALAGQTPTGVIPPPKSDVSATLVECASSVSQEARSATFAGEMSAIAGTAKMEMRVDVLERMPGEFAFRTVSAPGLGVWRSSAPGVKVYKYLKQVTNLAAPAVYRAAVRFRWVNARGRLIRVSELRSPRCLQPGPPATITPGTGPTTPGSGPSGAGGAPTLGSASPAPSGSGASMLQEAA